MLFLPKINELPDGNIFTVDAERFRVRTALFHQTFCCAATGGLAVNPGNTAGPTMRRAARSRTLQEGSSVRCGLSGEPRKPRSHTVRSGQEPQTQGGTASLLRVLAVSPGKTSGPTRLIDCAAKIIYAQHQHSSWSTWRLRQNCTHHLHSALEYMAPRALGGISRENTGR